MKRAVRPLLLAATAGALALPAAAGSSTAASQNRATVKATTSATTVEFLNGDAGTDNDNGLDAISLTNR